MGEDEASEILEKSVHPDIEKELKESFADDMYNNDGMSAEVTESVPVDSPDISKEPKPDSVKEDESLIDNDSQKSFCEKSDTTIIKETDIHVDSTASDHLSSSSTDQTAAAVSREQPILAVKEPQVATVFSTSNDKAKTTSVIMDQPVLLASVQSNSSTKDMLDLPASFDKDQPVALAKNPKTAVINNQSLPVRMDQLDSFVKCQDKDEEASEIKDQTVLLAKDDSLSVANDGQSIMDEEIPIAKEPNLPSEDQSTTFVNDQTKEQLCSQSKYRATPAFEIQSASVSKDEFMSRECDQLCSSEKVRPNAVTDRAGTTTEEKPVSFDSIHLSSASTQPSALIIASEGQEQPVTKDGPDSGKDDHITVVTNGKPAFLTQDQSSLITTHQSSEEEDTATPGYLDHERIDFNEEMKERARFAQLYEHYRGMRIVTACVQMDEELSSVREAAMMDLYNEELMKNEMKAREVAERKVQEQKQKKEDKMDKQSIRQKKNVTFAEPEVSAIHNKASGKAKVSDPVASAQEQQKQGEDTNKSEEEKPKSKMVN